MLVFTKAERKKAKLRLAVAGPAGSGKTFSALLLAFGLGGRVALIDTERSSGELYSDLGDYDVCALEPPFTPKKYIEAIKAAEEAGYNVIIIDSLSHAWAGPGGVLDMHDAVAAKERNSYTAWRHVTPLHNDLVDTMLQCKSHLIATMRSKTEYAQTQEGGKSKVQKVGMAPIQRDGLEYEFTVFCDLDLTHTAVATKDRTGLFDGITFRPSQEIGKKLLAWLNAGGPEKPSFEKKPVPEKVTPTPKDEPPAGGNPPAEAEVFEAELLVLGEPKKSESGNWTEVSVFNPVKDEMFTLAGAKKLLGDLKPEDKIRVKGQKKGSVIKPEDIKKVQEPKGQTFRVTTTTSAKEATKDFGQGLEPILWARGTLEDGTPVVLAARGEVRPMLKAIPENATTMVNGRLEVTEKGTYIYIEAFSAAA